MAKDTREIITAAFLKLARQNPSATSFNMTEIASEAKISRQAIYQKHFSKVEEIIDYIHKKRMIKFSMPTASIPRKKIIVHLSF